MIFVYDPQLKRQVPRIVDDVDWVTENNFDEIQKWINDNEHYVRNILARVPDQYIAIDVDASLLPTIESELYFHRIQSDYDENEYKRELNRW